MVTSCADEACTKKELEKNNHRLYQPHERHNRLYERMIQESQGLKKKDFVQILIRLCNQIGYIVIHLQYIHTQLHFTLHTCVTSFLWNYLFH